MRSYRGRRVDRKRPVDVYRNLRKGGWSVRQDGLVVAHTDAIMLRDVAFVVQKSGHRRAERTGVRNVHAWARGFITPSGMGTNAREAKDLPRLAYDRWLGEFTHCLTNLPAPSRVVRAAAIAAFNERGAHGAYLK